MKRGFSAYLDLVRISAAVVVFLHHLALDFGCYAPGAACAPLARMVPFHAGHSAVVIFFVLSGYVITYVASERERTLRQFALARAARIYSVAIPVLALVCCLDAYAAAGGRWAGIPVYQYAAPYKYVPLMLGFATDHWFLAENAFSLGAWWSVAYEVWYYVAFAAVFFARGWARWVLGGAVLLVMGPKLVALFPLWLFGSMVYRLHRAGASAGRAGPWVFGVTLALMAALLFSDVLPALNDGMDASTGGWIAAHLRFSQWFAGDLVLAVLFAANIYAAKDVIGDFGRADAPVRFVAAYTFTFYMVHGPVQKTVAQSLGTGLAATALLTIAFTFAFGQVTERQKGRLRRLLERALDRLEAPLSRLHKPGPA